MLSYPWEEMELFANTFQGPLYVNHLTALKNSSACPASEFRECGQQTKANRGKSSKLLAKAMMPLNLCLSDYPMNQNANVDFSFAENNLKTCGNCYNWRKSLKQMVILFSKRKLSSSCGRWGKEVSFSSKLSECWK